MFGFGVCGWGWWDGRGFWEEKGPETCWSKVSGPLDPLLAGVTGAETGKVCLTYKNLGKSTQPGRGPQAMIWRLKLHFNEFFNFLLLLYIINSITVEIMLFWPTVAMCPRCGQKLWHRVDAPKTFAEAIKIVGWQKKTKQIIIKVLGQGRPVCKMRSRSWKPQRKLVKLILSGLQLLPFCFVH